MAKEVNFRGIDIGGDAQSFRVFHTSVSVANKVSIMDIDRQQLLSGITLTFPASATTGIIVPTTAGCSDEISFPLVATTPPPSTPAPVYTASPTPAPVTPQPTPPGVDPLPPPPPPPPIMGCTDTSAANFDINAQQDDGSCVYTPPPVEPSTCRIYTLTATGANVVFNYNSCEGASQTITVNSGFSTQVCAEENSVVSTNPSQGTSTAGATCTGPVPALTPGYDCINDTCVYVNDNATYATQAECMAVCTPAVVAEITSCPSTVEVYNSEDVDITFDIPADATYQTNDGTISTNGVPGGPSEGIISHYLARQDDRGTGPGTHTFSLFEEIGSQNRNPFHFNMDVTFANGTSKNISCNVNVISLGGGFGGGGRDSD